MKTIGIIGGMGPMATADLFGKIVRLTRAASDQEHIPVVIDSNPMVPDRTAAILHGGPSPVPALIQSAMRLEGMGADLLAIACNTAHYYVDAIAEAVSIPIVNMLEETALEIKRRNIGAVALLGTDATVRTGIYHRALAKHGIQVLVPSGEGQGHVMDLIYDGVKAGRETFDTSKVAAELKRLTAAGAALFVLGCTELPIAFSAYRIDAPYIDPTTVLAIRCIELAGASLNL